MFEEPVNQIRITPEQAEWIKEGLAIRAKNTQQSQENRLSGLQTQYERVSNRLNRLFDDRLDGKMPNEELARAKEAEYAAQLNDLKYQIEETKKTTPDFYERGLKTLEILNLIQYQYVTENLKENGVILQNDSLELHPK